MTPHSNGIGLALAVQSLFANEATQDRQLVCKTSLAGWELGIASQVLDGYPVSNPSALQTDDIIEEWARGASRESFPEVMARPPKSEILEGDELPDTSKPEGIRTGSADG